MNKNKQLMKNNTEINIQLCKLLTECLLLIEEIEHGPTCNMWSNHRDAKCDCDVPLLISRIKKQLKSTQNLD